MEQQYMTLCINVLQISSDATVAIGLSSIALSA